MKAILPLTIFCLLTSACANKPRVAGPMALNYPKGEREDIVSREVALKSAGIKPVPAAKVGSYMDQHARELRQTLQLNKNFRLSRKSHDIIVTAQSVSVFEGDGLEVNKAFRASIGRLSPILQKYGKTLVTVVGHTNNQGDNRFNQNVSEARAEAVARVLKANNISSMRVRFAGEGEELPIASNKTVAGRARNDRVEIKISPIADY